MARVFSESSCSTRPSALTFADLDERLATGLPGVLLIRISAVARAAFASHAARRLRGGGRIALVATVAEERPGTSVFREIASQLGAGALPADPAAFAEALVAQAVAARAAIVLPLPALGSWDLAVARDLGSPPLPVVFLGAPDASGDATGGGETATLYDVGDDLAGGDKLRWLLAVAEEAFEQVPSHDLRALEAWWAHARRAPLVSAAGGELSARASLLRSGLAIAGRSLPLTALAALGSLDRASVASPSPSPEEIAAAVDELVRAGHATCAGDLVAPTSAVAAADAGPETISAVAELLVSGTPFEPDPWAHARAAELFLEVGRLDRADAASAAAQRGALGSATLSSELGARWFERVKTVGGEGGLLLRMKAAERALLFGEGDNAVRWCESAAILAPDDPEVHLSMGRALVQLGDLVAARVCLARAETGASGELAARVLVERAEVAYLGGDLDGASELASKARSHAATAATRLASRSTLGKILLARGAWDLADVHFAEDALLASSAGETTAELRARLNRAIALMSKGMLDESRAMLVRVLEDGTRLGEERARAFALSNLGLVAYRQHDYGAALRFWEETIRFPQALRGRLATALTIGNLADLRLRLGLVDHAEHAIAFGRRLLGASLPPRCASLFRWVSAQAALARRDTELARREIDAAIADALASGDRIYLESAYIVASRVALEDGDIERARVALANAEAAAKSPRACAEVSILLASHARAAGASALSAAEEALEAAQTAGEQDLLFEIHMLLALVQRDAGDTELARASLARALAIRDQVAAGLPADIRAAFLAKPDIVAAGRLEAALASLARARPEPEVPRAEDDAEPTRRRAERSEPPHERREMVGDDPQIRSLAHAIRKVAKSSSTVLIRGESGTGKELVAEALHGASDRASGPLVSVNCAALVETLLLSELFGHERGSFTGASSRRRGRFEMAEGGTLFLDEIGDISAKTQVALLRVLQEKTFERVGGASAIRADVRVICATHRDLRAMVERGEFREDLYYRLRGITLEVPALRARLGDLPRIAEHLLRRLAAERGEEPKRLGSDALELLCRHRWPGNVRELENVLRAAVLFAEGDVITTANLLENVTDLRAAAQSSSVLSRRPSAGSSAMPSTLDLDEPPASGASLRGIAEEDESALLPDDEANATAVAYAQVRQGAISLSDIKRQIERDCIARALSETKGNITRAAALLGMKRPRLSQLVKQYGLSAVTSSEGN